MIASIAVMYIVYMKKKNVAIAKAPKTAMIILGLSGSFFTLNPEYYLFGFFECTVFAIEQTPKFVSPYRRPFGYDKAVPESTIMDVNSKTAVIMVHFFSN